MKEREGSAVNERVRERERSEEAWYNGINRSTSQHHAAATVGETWNINQNIRTFERSKNATLNKRVASLFLNCVIRQRRKYKRLHLHRKFVQRNL